MSIESDRIHNWFNGQCPNCSEPIAEEVRHGDECSCGHTFEDPKRAEQEEREEQCKRWAKNLRSVISQLEMCVGQLESNDFLIEDSLEGAGGDLYAMQREIENTDLTPE